MANAIETRALGKRYRLGVDAAGYDTLREAMTRAVLRRRVPEERSIWALRDLNLDVAAGEAVGVVGRNGAGKTTLLKILAGITEPSAGEARTRGRVGALLDVGAGFHPELTGRENVYINGALLGMSRSDVRRRFNEIATFSGVERYLDTPVKRYSDGMRMRLAFAVAAHIEPPILVVDEVLAVGDAAFRERCLGRISEIGEHGRTVLFVSHDAGSITRVCSRAIWLEEGRLKRDGPADEVVAEYLGSGGGDAAKLEFEAVSAGPIELQAINVTGTEQGAEAGLHTGQPILVSIRAALAERLPGLDFAFSLIDDTGARVVYDARSDWTGGLAMDGASGTYEVSATLPPLLTAGRYELEIWIGSEHETLIERVVGTIHVQPRSDDLLEWIERPRAVQPTVEWQVRIDASANFEDS